MTAGWSGTSLQASDVADRAWGRVGVRRWDLWDAGEHVLLGPIASAFAPELDRLTRLVLDECEVRLYGEARERVVRTAQRVMVYDVVQAVRTGIIRELERPDPVPFTPPRSAPGIRGRSLRPGPEWSGLWHAFTGDLRTWGSNLAVRGSVRCGLLRRRPPRLRWRGDRSYRRDGAGRRRLSSVPADASPSPARPGLTVADRKRTMPAPPRRSRLQP